MMPAKSRLAGHLRLLGILWVAVSAFRLAPSLILLILVDHGVFRHDGAPGFLNPLIEGIAVVLLTLAGAGIIIGWGLLAKQPWARITAIVFGALNLVEMPFGTALGVYTLWVLLPAESEQQYKRITRMQAA